MKCICQNFGPYFDSNLQFFWSQKFCKVCMLEKNSGRTRVDCVYELSSVAIRVERSKHIRMYVLLEYFVSAQ